MNIATLGHRMTRSKRSRLARAGDSIISSVLGSTPINSRMKAACLKCGETFGAYSKWGTKKYCSRKCANSRTWTNSDKKKIAKGVTGWLKTNPPVATIVTCPCGVSFSKQPKNKKIYCSPKCANKFKRKSPGGYRKGSGRSKVGYYNGIYCGSTYELAYLIYCMDHSVPIKRYEGYFLTEESKRYYPDFEVNNTIVEIKGYVPNPAIQKAKEDAVLKTGRAYQVLYKKDLEQVFEYVRATYSTSKFEELYSTCLPTG